MYRIFSFIAIFFLLLLAFFGISHYYHTTETKYAAPETVTVPLGLPPIPWPKDNPYTKEKAELGRLLYFDTRLSSDHTISCATCHNMTCGYSDCKAIAIGIDDNKGARHSPTIINAAYSTIFFWDGRAASLEQQSEGPLANTKEMTKVNDPHEAHRKCVECIQDIPGYKPLFVNAFGNDEITLDKITKAIATFERTVLSGNSPFDRYVAGDRTALTAEQVRGLKVFKKVGCANCHGGFNFTDDRFQNIGVGMDAPNPDLGRYVITHKELDWGAFKTPTLREVEHTAPYMHDGSHATLEEVVEYYDIGGIPNKNLSPLMKPLNLSPVDKKALVSFLKALSGEGWQHIQEPVEFPN
jgi:cytochrome c peroxidase